MKISDMYDLFDFLDLELWNLIVEVCAIQVSFEIWELYLWDQTKVQYV